MARGAALREAGKEATGPRGPWEAGQGSPEEHPHQQPGVTAWALRPKEARGFVHVDTNNPKAREGNRGVL